MDYQVYRLKFQGAVHFGRNSLEGSSDVFCADTLFSALYQEAVKAGQDFSDRLYRYVINDELLFSDAFPYIGDTYYLPKPMMRIQAGDHKGDSVVKKAYKKLRYIPAEKLDSYLRGDYDVLSEQNIGRDLGRSEMKVSASIRGEEETRPYRTGCYFYKEGSGLYFIAGYRNPSAKQLLGELLDGLAYSGIGGKRSAGLGRFTFETGALPADLYRRLERNGSRYMTLSVSLPTEDEMEHALAGAGYLLCKRSGFVASDRFAPEQQRKRDLYVFSAGACVKTRYKGDIYNVADHNGSHPVYRYARPMFMEVDV